VSAAVKTTRMNHTAAELRAFAARSRDSAQSRRLLAIALLLDGASRLEAARQAGMDRQTLRDWVHRYNEMSVDGLISHTAPGPAPRLTKGEWKIPGPLCRLRDDRVGAQAPIENSGSDHSDTMSAVR